MKIALVQTDSGRDREKNIEILAHLGEQVKDAELVITPECSNLMGYWPSQDELFTVEEEPVVKMGRAWAKDHECYLLLGSVLLRDEDRGGAVNRQLLIDSKGEIKSYYDKINMFDVDLPDGQSFRESDKFVPGERAIVTKIGDVQIGHSICYDLRFPALYRVLSQAGANVLVIPSAFTRLTGRAHWQSLLRARAIENGAFVLAPAQCGEYVYNDGSKRSNWGHSLVISPWGEILSELGDKPDVSIVDLELGRVQNARQQIPAWETDQKFELDISTNQ